MGITKLLIIAASFTVLATSQAVEQDPNSFEALLQESGLQFQAPAGFRDTAIEPDYVMPYEKRLVAEDGQLELRYAIRPLGRVEIDYSDPHGSAPAPNDLFEMLFRTLTETMAGKTHVFSRNTTPEEARMTYNAGWAAIGVFDIVSELGNGYREAMLIAIHQNDKADAYTLMLTNDLDGQRERIKAIRGSLKFASFDNPINMPPSPEELKNLPMIPETSE